MGFVDISEALSEEQRKLARAMSNWYMIRMESDEYWARWDAACDKADRDRDIEREEDDD